MITWQGPSFGLKMTYVLVVFSHDRMREFFGVLFIRALIPFIRALPLWSNHHKGPISKYPYTGD